MGIKHASRRRRAAMLGGIACVVLMAVRCMYGVDLRSLSTHPLALEGPFEHAEQIEQLHDRIGAARPHPVSAVCGLQLCMFRRHSTGTDLNNRLMSPRARL